MKVDTTDQMALRLFYHVTGHGVTTVNNLRAAIPKAEHEIARFVITDTERNQYYISALFYGGQIFSVSESDDEPVFYLRVDTDTNEVWQKLGTKPLPFDDLENVKEGANVVFSRGFGINRIAVFAGVVSVNEHTGKISLIVSSVIAAGSSARKDLYPGATTYADNLDQLFMA